MSSFINLMANDIWTDADITRRTEAMLRTEFSQEAETILNRKVIGMSLGTYTPSPQDQADMARYNETALASQAAGVAARADMALLLATMTYETAIKRLAQPLPPEDATDEAKAQDAAERVAAQAVVDGASQDVVDLYTLRNPPAPPAPEPAPEPEPVVEAE
jgi:hypothetical protein